MAPHEKRLQDFWKFADQRRGTLGPGELIQEWIGSLTEPVTLDEIPRLATQFSGAFGPVAALPSVPPVLADFVQSYLQGNTIQNVMDPHAGMGAFLATVQHATNATNVVAYEPNEELAKIGQLLNPTASWKNQDFLRQSSDHVATHDVVVSLLPFGGRTPANLATTMNRKLGAGASDHIYRDAGQQLLVQSSKALSDDGVGIFVTTPNFFWSQSSPFRRLPDLGLGVEAALEIFPGAISPSVSITAYLVFIRKRHHPELFVGELSRHAPSNQRLLENLKAWRNGRDVEEGKLVPTQEFVGLGPLRIAEHFRHLEEKFGGKGYYLIELVIDSVRGGRSDDFVFPERQNAIYIPTVGKSNVVNSIEDLSLKPQNYLQLTIDPAKTDAQFVAQFLNSDVGREIRQLSMRGATISHLSLSSLKTLRVIVPPPEMQARMLAVTNQIAEERNVLNDLQSQLSSMQRELWTSPHLISSIETNLISFTKKVPQPLRDVGEQGFRDWIETLPFPLASVLHEWRNTSKDDYKTRYEHLLHFFEAATAFYAVILLSAFEAKKEELRPAVLRSLQQAHGDMKRPSFGAWKAVYDNLAKQVRSLLRNEETAIECASLFVDETLALPRTLANSELSSLFQEANKIRNRTTGHGGAVGPLEARNRHESVYSLLTQFRELTIGQWEAVQLVKADVVSPRRDRIDTELLLLMGSHSGFDRVERPMQSLLNLDSLFILNNSSDVYVELLDLMRLGPTPDTVANAIYFYNRMERGKFGFVSYHYAPQSELSIPASQSFEALTGGWFSAIEQQN